MRVDDEALVARVSGRSSCGNCGEVFHDETKPPSVKDACDNCGSIGLTRRSDDNAESMRVRLMAYYRSTSPLIGYYHAKGKLRTIDGLGEIENVAAELKKALDA
jgi:adenylate kinase